MSAASQTDGTIAILVRARGFIERGWCQGAAARDASGRSVPPDDPRAVAWCAWGALIAAGVPHQDAAHPAILRLTVVTGAGQIVPYNDTQDTVFPVLAAFDRAIAGNIAAEGEAIAASREDR